MTSFKLAQLVELRTALNRALRTTQKVKVSEFPSAAALQRAENAWTEGAAARRRHLGSELNPWRYGHGPACKVERLAWAAGWLAQDDEEDNVGRGSKPNLGQQTFVRG